MGHLFDIDSLNWQCKAFIWSIQVQSPVYVCDSKKTKQKKTLVAPFTNTV